MSRALEKTLVEDYVAQNLEKLGWQFVAPEELGRESLREPLLVERLKKAILRINPDLGIGEEELKKVIDELKLLTSGQEGVRKFLRFLKYGIGVKFEKERVVKIINLFDFENLQDNEFIFSRQVHFRGKELIIPDIVLFVNGIPLGEIECKSLVDLRVSWEQAFYQVKDYEKLVPELYKYLQIGIAFAEKVRYFPIVPWQKNVPVYLWKKENLAEDEAIFEMLIPAVLLNILRDFLFLREEHNEVKKIISRYMQYRAVNKIYQRVINNLEGKSKKNKGLIWHWQGSGKTLTMIFAAHKLFFDKRLENPTIFIIVDRRDLEEQMKMELSSLRLNFSFETIENIKALKEVISFDNFRGKRGVFLTLIHKFRPEERFLPENLPQSISQRKNIICFLDEVHRTQYGKLAAQMKNILKSAFFFGFTGTPIAEDERNTYQEFGYPLKEEGYLDKYFLDDSQKDGFTLPLVYLPRLEEKVHLKEKEIQWFIEKIEAEDLDELQREKIKEGVRKRLNYINVFLENEERIKKIAQDIAKHFQENVEGRFKAMVVCGSRKACVLYKKHLEKHLPSEYCEVVMTFDRGEEEPIKSFYEKWQKRYKSFPDDRLRIKNIIENYKEQDLPKILIVTDMLITGFDAPILQTMYLDKLLKKHHLLQAIARTNRPFGGVKAVGLIVDYVGILKHINSALKNYYKENLTTGIVDFSGILEEFRKAIKNLEKIFREFEYRIERKILLRAIDLLREEEVKNDFVENYKKARKLFEVLGSSPVKLKYLKEFEWFTAVYEYWKKLTASPEIKEKTEKFFRKTLRIIHQNMEIQRLEKSLPAVTLNIQYLSKIQRSALSLEEKAVNILFALEKLVLVEQHKNPIYHSILDQLNELVKKWKERRIDYQELLKEEGVIIKSIKENERKRERLALRRFDYGILLILESNLEKEKDWKKLKKFTIDIRNLISQDLIENWQENPTLRQNIERKIREYLLLLKQKYHLSYNQFDSLHKKLVVFIRNYGYATS